MPRFANFLYLFLQVAQGAALGLLLVLALLVVLSAADSLSLFRYQNF